MMLVVVSTGMNPPTKNRCLESVARQSLQPDAHVYIEATEQAEPRSCLQNYDMAIRQQHPEAIICQLDGDDWLADASVLEKVHTAHQQGAWMTYGSFELADGRAGMTEPQAWPPRSNPWRASHLKTFRASLWHRLTMPWNLIYDRMTYPSDLENLLAHDQYTMIGMLEMAGQDRVKHIQDILYIYNALSSFGHNCDKDGWLKERSHVDWTRSLPPYARLESL